MRMKLPRFFGKQKLTPTQERLWLALQFLIRFALLAAPVYIILDFSVPLTPLQQAVTGNVDFLLTSLGYNVSADGPMLTVAGPTPFQFIISEDCTGWKSLLCFLALVLAVPGVCWKERLYGLIGLPLVYAANLLRIIGIVLLQQAFGNEIVKLVHDWLWSAGLIMVVLAVWFVWLLLIGKVNFPRKARKRAPRKA